MAVFCESVTTAASPERVWALWTDPSTWKLWNPSVTEMSWDGPFAAGTKLLMTTPERGSFPLHITGVFPPRSFTADLTAPPGSSMSVTCEVTPNAEGGSTISQSANIGGPLGGVWGALMGKMIAKRFGIVVAALAKYAEDGAAGQGT
jgi:uncharacterized protein YndB with AHSA1/START domain